VIDHAIYLFIMHKCSTIKNTQKITHKKNIKIRKYTATKSIPNRLSNVHSRTQQIFGSIL